MPAGTESWKSFVRQYLQHHPGDIGQRGKQPRYGSRIARWPLEARIEPSLCRASLCHRLAVIACGCSGTQTVLVSAGLFLVSQKAAWAGSSLSYSFKSALAERRSPPAAAFPAPRAGFRHFPVSAEIGFGLAMACSCWRCKLSDDRGQFHLQRRQFIGELGCGRSSTLASSAMTAFGFVGRGGPVERRAGTLR